MNIGGLVSTLLPVFFVLALGYFAGRRNACGTGNQSNGTARGYSAGDGRSGEESAGRDGSPAQPSAVLTGLKAGLQSPLLWAPILGIAVVLAGIHLPAVVASSLKLIGSATSGVAVFAVALVLAAYPVRLSRAVWAGSLARITVHSAILFVLLHLLHVARPFARESLVCCSFPLATVVVLFASRYKAAQSETAAMPMLSTLALAITVKAMLGISR
jgi:malonate transporter and related proteins